MEVESVSGTDSFQGIDWNDKEGVANWNGRTINTVQEKQTESRISSVALQRAQFNNARTGFVLCKNESNSGSSSDSKRSDDKSSDSKRSDNKESDSKRSDDNESKTEVKQQVSVGGKSVRDHGYASDEVHGSHKATLQFPNGNTLEITSSLKHERTNEYGDNRDRTSGEIDASYNY